MATAVWRCEGPGGKNNAADPGGSAAMGVGTFSATEGEEPTRAVMGGAVVVHRRAVVDRRRADRGDHARAAGMAAAGAVITDPAADGPAPVVATVDLVGTLDRSTAGVMTGNAAVRVATVPSFGLGRDKGAEAGGGEQEGDELFHGGERGVRSFRRGCRGFIQTAAFVVAARGKVRPSAGRVGRTRRRTPRVCAAVRRGGSRIRCPDTSCARGRS